MAEAFNPFDSAVAFDPFAADTEVPQNQDGALTRGTKRAINSARSAYNLATGDADTGAQLAADRAAYEQANPGTQAGNELMAAWQNGDGVAGGISGVAGEIAKDWRDAPNIRQALSATGENLSAMGGGIVEQVPNMVAPMVGMGAGALAGSAAGPGGTAAGMFAGASVGNTAMESGEKIDQALRAANINPQDKAAVSAFLAENGDKILGQAAVKGSIIGAVDTATMKMGGALLHGPAGAATERAIKALGLDITDKAALKAAESQIAAQVAADPIYLASKAGGQAVARNVGAAALEPAGEFAGEYLGEGVSTGDWDTKNAALEALSAVGQGAIVYGGQKIYQAATDPLRNQVAPPAPATTEETDQAIGQFGTAMDQYQNLVPGQQARIGYDPAASVIEVPTQTGGTATIDRNDGAISAAVVDTGIAEQVRSGSLLQSYATQMDAQAALEQRPDADRMRIASHPRSAGRFAVVPKTSQELAAIDAKSAAKLSAEVRGSQLEQEDGNAAPAPKPVEAAAAPQAPVVVPDVAPILQQDAAQEELAPTAAQPVASMPGVERMRQNRLAAARTEAQARGAQVIDDEVAGANTAPTEGQKAAGNYAKGHAKIGSLDIAIENPAGSERSGVEGKKGWKTKMSAHYGYIKRTLGNDGDQVDVYVKPGTPTDHTGPVFVVDQFNPATGQFDEHKSFVGFSSAAEAQKSYDAHFSDKSGPKRRGGITEMTQSAFKEWAQKGDTSRPASDARTEADKANEEIAQSTGAKFARKRGETQEQYHQRMAAESNAKKAQRQSAFKPVSNDAVADVREALGDPKATVSIVSEKDLPNAEDAGAGEVSKQTAGFLGHLAKMFGKKVVFVASLPADGFYLRGDTIYLSTNSSVHHARLMGHEMLHALRKQAPKAYDAMTKALSGLVTPAELRAQFRDYFADKKGWTDAQIDNWLTDDSNRDMITEEWLADLSGNRFAESDFWTSVFAKIEEQQGSVQAKGIIGQLRMALNNALNKLMSLIKGNQFAVDARMAGQLDEIRDAIAAGFADYAKAVKDGQAVDQEQGGAKFARPSSDNGHKRTKDGDYVGAPAGMTPSKLGALRARLKALALEGEPGRFWYEDSSQVILAASEGDPAMAEKLAGLLAIYSPNATVSGNTTMGLKALYQWANGDEIKVRFGPQNDKATAWMNGTMGEEDALQIKTGAFFKNLMRKIDEDRYGFDKQGATIDMWMARVFGYGSKAIGSEARYYFAEREVKKIGDELGWEPQQVQAALWVAIKSRIESIADVAREEGKKNGWLKRVERKSGGKINISWEPIDGEAREKYEALILKKALATGADPSGLTKAAYHFGTALRERVGQISWEAMPGKTTGVLPGIFNAPLEQQVEYLQAMDAALRDENGQDLIAKKLNLPVLNTAMGPSAWQMNVGAGAQSEVVIPAAKGEGVSPSAKSLLNIYAAIRGYVLNQEAVVWHLPLFDASKKNANGIQLDFGRDPTHDEVVSLYNAIHEVSGRDDWAPAYVPGVGVRVLNFSDVPNIEFHKLIKQAILADGVPDVHLATFQSEGDYVGNDWVTSPDGAEYKEIISGQDSKRASRGTGRSDLQGWVESELRPRAERVNQEFAAKYGWSLKRSDAVSDERSGSSAGREPGQELQGYGVAQPGAVTVQGIHYSGAERTNLDGRYYGTGAKGDEAARVREADDPRLKERVYFYVNKGNGVTPEQGVGSVVHTAQLNNIYDLDADTWLQAKLPRGLSGDTLKNAFESAVIDNGFDGYVSDFGTQRAAVLLGRHSVPVTRGGTAKVSEVKQAAPTPVTDRVKADRLLPSGKMTGAEWKRSIPEATMLEDDKAYYKDDVVGQLRQAKLSTKRFYSPLARQIEAAPDKVFGSAKQVSNWLMANAGKLGVKQDEIQWTGITDWLAMQQKVSKADVLGYLAQNGVQVEDVKKGGQPDINTVDQAIEYIAKWRGWSADDVRDEYGYSNASDYITLANELKDDEDAPISIGDSTKYHQYTLPGGENYRELLLTLPGEKIPQRKQWLLIDNETGEAVSARATEPNQRWLDDVATGDYSIREQMVNDDQADVRQGGTGFRSAHWDERNILAHVRFNDRTDAEGSKVLFIEELQSDWGQEGKKKGFEQKRKLEPLSNADFDTFVQSMKDEAAKAIADKLGGDLNMAKGVVRSQPLSQIAEWAGMETEWANMQARQEENHAFTNGDRFVPKGPFVTDTKSWLSLGIKRMIAYAVENGYDKVAFVNGQQSADRYSLSKKISRLEWKSSPGESTGVLIGWDSNGYGVLEKEMTPAEAEDHVGKELADRLINGPVNHETARGRQVRRIEGADLEVGGEGMKAFYDKIVPQTINDVLKKVGGGKVEIVSLNTGVSSQDWAEANSRMRKQLAADGAVTNQLGFAVTPEMQASVAQGLPMFSLKRVIDNTIGKVDAAVDGLSNLPGQFDYLKDRYLTLGKIARIDEISKEVRRAFDKATPSDKKAVYDYLTTRGATTGAVVDPALKAIAKRIKDTINYTGDQLVARGLLDQQARDHYKDQYLPRMYLRHLLDDNSAKVIGMGKKPSDLGYLKHRKDIPPEIRELILGEVKDPAFLSVNAIGRAMRDVSLMDWMGKISQNNDWVFPEVFTQWNGRKVTAYWLRAEADRVERQAEHYDAKNKPLALAKVAQMRTQANQTLGSMSAVDHKLYKQIPDTMRYGLLRGMWVRTEIFNDIMGASQIVNADPTWFEDWFGFGGKGTQLTQWWKFTKVALNPPGQIRNFISNMVMLQLSGVGLHKLPLRLIEAARDIANDGPYWKVAKKYGVTESTFTAQELFRVKRDLIDLEAKQGKVNSLRFLMAAGSSFLEKVSDLYQFSEALGKTIKIIDEMKAGKSEAEAAIEAQKWLFDYSLVPQSVRLARNAPIGMPFITYQIKVLPRLLEVAAKYPWRFLPWVGLLYGMQAAVASMFGVDDDELKKLKKSLPEWLQDRSHTVFLPMRDADGRLQVADVGYFFPWTFYTQVGMHAADGKIKKALVDDLGGMFSAPIVGAGAALMSNYDTFTHKPIYNETDPVGYQAAAIANYAYDLMAPPFLSSHGVVSPMGLADKKFGGKMVQALSGTTNKFGDPKATEEQAIGALVGINFYGMDPEHTRLTNMQVMNGKVRDAERALRQRLMDRGMSQEERQSVMAAYQAKMMQLQQEMVEYARESEVPQQLRVLKRQ